MSDSEASESEDDTIRVLGTPVEEERSSGSKSKFVPIHSQIVTDSEGRQRFHGAFTGGFSAGFYNTVGSKEGWAPQQFVSSRSAKAERKSFRPEDFMDEEDLGESHKAGNSLVVRDAFDRLTRDEDADVGAKVRRKVASSGDKLWDVIAPVKDSIGMKLLKTMGYREGHGIGPRTKRSKKKKYVMKRIQGPRMPDDEEMPEVRREVVDEPDADPYALSHSFAPANTRIYKVKPKANLWGIGYDPLDDAEDVRAMRDRNRARERQLAGVERDGDSQRRIDVNSSGASGGLGIGALDDYDAHDDVYGHDSMSNYDIDISGARARQDRDRNQKPSKDDQKSSVSSANKNERAAPRRRGRDGTFPIDGFVVAERDDKVQRKKNFPRLDVPPNFREVHRFETVDMALSDDLAKFQITRARKSSGRMNAERRGRMLGEKPLPGRDTITPDKKVVDLISDSDRSRLSSSLASNFVVSHQQTSVLSEGGLYRPPSKPKDPLKELRSKYSDDLNKQARFDKFIDKKLGIEPDKDGRRGFSLEVITDYQRRQESADFESALKTFCAANPKFEAQRSEVAQVSEDKEKRNDEVISRRTEEWRPHRLLCKRFNVPNPYEGIKEQPKVKSALEERSDTLIMDSQRVMGGLMQFEAASTGSAVGPKSEEEKKLPQPSLSKGDEDEDEDAAPKEREDEEEKPSMDLFKAIFEADDSDSESEDDESSDEDEDGEDKEAESKEHVTSNDESSKSSQSKPDVVPSASSSSSNTANSTTSPAASTTPIPSSSSLPSTSASNVSDANETTHTQALQFLNEIMQPSNSTESTSNNTSSNPVDQSFHKSPVSNDTAATTNSTATAPTVSSSSSSHSPPESGGTLPETVSGRPASGSPSLSASARGPSSDLTRQHAEAVTPNGKSDSAGAARPSIIARSFNRSTKKFNLTQMQDDDEDDDGDDFKSIGTLKSASSKKPPKSSKSAHKSSSSEDPSSSHKKKRRRPAESSDSDDDSDEWASAAEASDDDSDDSVSSGPIIVSDDSDDGEKRRKKRKSKSKAKSKTSKSDKRDAERRKKRKKERRREKSRKSKSKHSERSKSHRKEKRRKKDKERRRSAKKKSKKRRRHD